MAKQVLLLFWCSCVATDKWIVMTPIQLQQCCRVVDRRRAHAHVGSGQRQDALSLDYVLRHFHDVGISESHVKTCDSTQYKQSLAACGSMCDTVAHERGSDADATLGGVGHNAADIASTQVRVTQTKPALVVDVATRESSVDKCA